MSSMSDLVVLDASALLALVNQEPGYQIVEKQISCACMSTVNVSEVIAVLTDIGVSHVDADAVVKELIHEIIPFDHEQAAMAAQLRAMKKSYGLSLGNRACLALAKVKDLPVLTADKAWTRLKMDLNIKFIW